LVNAADVKGGDAHMRKQIGNAESWFFFAPCPPLWLTATLVTGQWTSPIPEQTAETFIQ